MAEMRVEIYSHYFVVRDVTPRNRPALEGFSRRYIQFGLVRENGRYFRAPLRVFAAATAARTEYRFHINTLEEFKRHILLAEYRLTEPVVEWVTMTTPQATAISLAVREGWVLRDYQEPAVEYIVAPPPPRAKFISLQTGKGKAVTLDTKVKVPGGWTTMGEVIVGTTVVAPDGSPTQVTAVYPQGEKEIFKITFFDGRSVECCDEHQWRVFVSSSPSYWKVMSTKELREFGRLGNKRCYVELIEPEDVSDKNLPIDPYVMGVLLGDAHIGERSIELTNPEDFIIDKVATRLPVDVELRKRAKELCHGVRRTTQSGAANSYLAIFKGLGLAGKLSYQKSVPDAYLHASKQQRLDLLQGLMDTDGYAGKSGEVSFTSTSLELAQAVQYLVRSLGGIAGIVAKQKSFLYHGERKKGRPSYNVLIRHKRPSELFSLPRKKERVRDDNQYAPTIKLRIDKIEHAGRKQAQCITVDHPSHLFVVTDFIVTHNSFIAMTAAAQLGQRFALIVRPSYIEKWLIDFNKTYNEEIAECLMVVQGSAQLQALLQMAALGELDGNKIILFSNKTLQNWIKLYEQNGSQILEQGYACLPDQLFEFLGVGVRIIDEVHQDFHLNFKLDLYTHVERSISLSATLLSEDDFLNNMYELAYPKGERFNGIAYDKYIDARAALYSFNDPRKIRVTEYGSKTYSHHAFEKSILRSESTTAAYFDMIRQVANGTFFKNYKPGQRLLVYCSSINMCTKLADYLRMQYPRLVINRYVEDDPFDYVMESDICVSTLQSAGTGIDIPNLTTVIMTPAVRSSAANIQGFGRLRKLADDTPVMFIYFVCQDFPKHTKYHEIKKVLLEERARTFKEEYLGRPI